MDKKGGKIGPRAYPDYKNVRILDETGNDISSQYPDGVPMESVLPLPDPGERPLATHYINFSYGGHSSEQCLERSLRPISDIVSYWRHGTDKNNDLTFSHLESGSFYKASDFPRSLPGFEYISNYFSTYSCIKDLTLRRDGDQFKPELVFLIPCDYDVTNALAKKANELYREWKELYPDLTMSEHLKLELFAAAHRHKFIPIQLYVNGIPLETAIQKLKEKTVPFDTFEKKS